MSKIEKIVRNGEEILAVVGTDFSAPVKFENGAYVNLTAEEVTQRQADEAAYEAEKPRVAVLTEIQRLEALETPRRLAEAMLTQEGKDWLQASRDQIAAERAKL